MGVATTLGYSHRERGAFHGAVAGLVSRSWMTAIVSRVTTPLDRAALRLTSGTSTVSDWFVGLPPLWVTATGAKSGQPRTVPLYGIPVAEELALIGTSFGREATPGWVYNLEANPNVSVRYKEIEVGCRARRTAGQEEERIWQAAETIYPGYSVYRQRVTNREIRVFMLESTG